jgi:DNA-binding NarL/FixJ family response regulator
MKKKILWIDDDYYAISGLFRPLELGDYKIVPAISALDGFREAQKWREYNLIVVDLIIPITQQQETAPEIVRSWEDEKENRHVGVGIVKWLLQILKVTCPVVILSIVRDPINAYGLSEIGLAGSIQKGELLPSALKSQVEQILNSVKEKS